MYDENIVWPSVPGITLMAADTASLTEIRGGRSSSVIYIDLSGQQEDSTAMIQGFTLSGGGGEISFGGGLHVRNARVHLDRMTVTDNLKGGVYAFASYARMSHSIVSENREYGGIFLQSSDGDITASRILNNISTIGGGIRSGGRLTIEGSTIHGNSSTSGTSEGGGGIYSTGRYTEIISSVISSNSATYGGGLSTSRVTKLHQGVHGSL